MNKELTSLVSRLERRFPNLKLYNEGHYICDEKGFETEDFSPPFELTWYEIIEQLKEEGLEIKNIKEK